MCSRWTGDWSSDVCSSDLSSSLASSGVQVTADAGDLVSWCPDVTSTGVVLRIVSKRTYALEASYLSDWSATLAGPVDPVTTAILKEIGRASCRERVDVFEVDG